MDGERPDRDDETPDSRPEDLGAPRIGSPFEPSRLGAWTPTRPRWLGGGGEQPVTAGPPEPDPAEEVTGTEPIEVVAPVETEVPEPAAVEAPPAAPSLSAEAVERIEPDVVDDIVPVESESESEVMPVEPAPVVEVEVPEPEPGSEVMAVGPAPAAEREVPEPEPEPAAELEVAEIEVDAGPGAEDAEIEHAEAEVVELPVSVEPEREVAEVETVEPVVAGQPDPEAADVVVEALDEVESDAAETDIVELHEQVPTVAEIDADVDVPGPESQPDEVTAEVAEPFESVKLEIVEVEPEPEPAVEAAAEPEPVAEPVAELASVVDEEPVEQEDAPIELSTVGGHIERLVAEADAADQLIDGTDLGAPQFDAEVAGSDGPEPAESESRAFESEEPEPEPVEPAELTAVNAEVDEVLSLDQPELPTLDDLREMARDLDDIDAILERLDADPDGVLGPEADVSAKP